MHQHHKVKDTSDLKIIYLERMRAIEKVAPRVSEMGLVSEKGNSDGTSGTEIGRVECSSEEAMDIMLKEGVHKVATGYYAGGRSPHNCHLPT